MAARAEIWLLVGPKGSGKTTLGRMLGDEPGAHFLEVELIAKRVLQESGGTVDESYARRAFEAIADEVLAISESHRILVLETTGASTETKAFIERLSQHHRVRLIRVHARAETCARRIARRDPSRQVEVSAELIRVMHARTEALQLGWHLELDNDPPLSRDEVLDRVRSLAE